MTVIQFPIKERRAVRNNQELREIGMKIIASPEFQDEIKKSGKATGPSDNPLDEWAPYDPVAVAIMRGFYDK